MQKIIALCVEINPNREIFCAASILFGFLRKRRFVSLANIHVFTVGNASERRFRWKDFLIAMEMAELHCRIDGFISVRIEVA